MEARKTVRGRGKSTDFAFNFYIVDFGEKKRPLRARVYFFHTVFINPDIYIGVYKSL